MKFILSFGSVTAAIWLLALGEFVRAQGSQQRAPIAEFPPGEDMADDGNEPQPADGGRSGGGLRGLEGEPVEMSDTLFLPAESGADPAGAGLPDSAPDGPIDEATMGMAAVAPKDDQLQLMQLYEGLREFDNAIAAAELVLERDPNNKEALAGMARLMIETGRSQQALRLCDKLQKLDPGVNSQGLMASALISAARYEEAELILQQMKAAHRGPSPFPFETMLGFVELDRGKKKEAREIFEVIESGSGYDAMEVDTARKQLLLMDLDDALAWRDLEKAQTVVERLRDEYAGEAETAAAEAVLQFLNGEEAAAAGELAALRSEFPRLTLYPFLVQLADFSYAAGDFDGAEAAYAEVLEDPRSRPLARESVVRNRAQLRMREGEQASAGVGAISGDEGALVTSQARIRKGLGEHWYLGGEFTRQDIDLDGPGSKLGEDERMEGWLSAERSLERGRYAEARVGGSDAGVMGAVTVGKRARLYADAWLLGVGANERANDSAQLAALDGRQYRVSGMYQRELTPRVVISAEAIARQVEIDGDEFGNGVGVDFDLAYRLNQDERRSNYFVAWHSRYEKFDRSGDDFPSGAAADELAAQLIQPEYSRHGLELRHEGQWHESLFTRAMAGLYYRADSSDLEASGGVGLDWFFEGDLRLYIDALYTSNGEAGNAGSGVIEAMIGVAKGF